MDIRIGAAPLTPRIDTAIRPREASADNTVREFGQFLQDALANVEGAQQDAATAARKLATGEIKDVAEVTIASEKATLALQLTVQVRNKVLEAYQDIMRMPV